MSLLKRLEFYVDTRHWALPFAVTFNIFSIEFEFLCFTVRYDTIRRPKKDR